MIVDVVLSEDTGETLSFRWTEGANCAEPEAHDFTSATFAAEWLGVYDNVVKFTTPGSAFAGGPAGPSPQANVVMMIDAGSLTGKAGTYRLRLIEDPTGVRNVFRSQNLPVFRIDPAPTP